MGVGVGREEGAKKPLNKAAKNTCVLFQTFSFRLNNDFRLPENKHVYQSLEITSENAITLYVT